MTIEILTYPHKLLKVQSKPVQKVTSAITDFVQDLFAAMYASETGIGLAAPQVGENLNIFVMDVSTEDPDDPEKRISNPVCLINPQIITRAGVIVYEEGCLSCPELLVEVERSKNITVKALDAEGRAIERPFADLSAVCIQHEMDHLKGKLLVDHISRLKRDLYRKQRIRWRRDEDDNGAV